MLRGRDYGVPHHLILHILGKLPVKSLLRFKSVSKQWFRSTIDPDFTDRHLLNQKKRDPGFMTANSTCCINKYNFGIEKVVFMDSMVVNKDNNTIPHCYTWLTDVPCDHYTMLNSCDGILCFYGLSLTVFVLNPSTKEYRFLPNMGWYCHSLPRLGFGRDAVTKRYKIVRVLNPCPSHGRPRGCCLVITLDPNPDACWRSIGEIPYVVDSSSPSVHVDGAIYWLTDEIFHLNKSEVIVMFDLHVEKFQPIPHPSCCSDKNRGTMQLGTLRECLCLAQQETECRLNIWKMEKQQQKITWEKLYCILLFRNDLRVGPRFAFAEHRDGTLLVCSEDKVYLYKQNRHVCYVSIAKIGPRRTTAFTESLVTVYGKTLSRSQWR
ncbi:hypothetical protein V6N13_090653 [Hibiscus sabdariffa]|uniref:F-box domain-containing protein n=1 Tax=Hibiscus sabdariffa TaxID=183260 RepID=A0ABR2NXB3_9ROSI